jgi:two-component system, LytTR family, sensor kinase
MRKGATLLRIMDSRSRKAAALVAAWLPMVVLWTVLAMVYAQLTLVEAFARATLTIGSAALLGIGVWHFCGTTRWPDAMRVGFYLRHLLGGVVYAVLWVAFTYAFEPLLSGATILGALRASRILGWQLIMALWVYAVIAGVSYAIQSQKRARLTEQRALLAEAAATAARLEAIRSRLHPHFLFNALHTVTALIRCDAEQAEIAIEKLAAMLRYTLAERASDPVSFAEEWEFTRRYLDFEQLRYGDRLLVDAAIEPDSLLCSSPSFALQTLVENAVRHAVAVRAEGGRIEIAARRSGETLVVSVTDDGTAKSESRGAVQFGLSALRERLTTLYDGQAQLSAESNGSGFVASYTVPQSRFGASDAH